MQTVHGAHGDVGGFANGGHADFISYQEDQEDDPGSTDGLADFISLLDEPGLDDRPTGLATPVEPLIAVVDEISHEEFERRFRHREPVLLRGYAREWPALSRWHDLDNLSSALDDDDSVLCLTSGDGHRFLGIDCEQDRRPLRQVVREVLGLDQSASKDGAARESPDSRLYARAPLRGGLRQQVSLEGIEYLMGGRAAKPACCSVWIGHPGNVTPFHVRACASNLPTDSSGCRLALASSIDKSGSSLASPVRPLPWLPRWCTRPQDLYSGAAR